MRPYADTSSSSEDEKAASIAQSDDNGESTGSAGSFATNIDKDGKRVLITWTRQDERKVVRKADLLFLPVFLVRPQPPALCCQTDEIIAALLLDGVR